MKGQKVLHSSESDEWSTPQNFYDILNKEFIFTLDVAANKDNAKTEKYYNIDQNSLIQEWSGNSCWMNPPYSKIKDFITKAANEKDVTVVALIPSRTDTKWFHEHCYKKENVEIRFIKGRLKFGNSKNSAPFPSMLVIFRNKKYDKDTNN